MSTLSIDGVSAFQDPHDVPAEKVVETVKAENIKIVALSGVLTLAIDSMKNTIDALKAAGTITSPIITENGRSPIRHVYCFE